MSHVEFKTKAEFNIHQMDLLEIATPFAEGHEKFLSVMRVPGGWIFLIRIAGTKLEGIFVPYSNEFKHP